jgi:hypothetical protein
MILIVTSKENKNFPNTILLASMTEIELQE